MRKKNKYEDIKMIDLDDKADISDIYIEHLYNTDKTVGFIASKELVEYVLENVIKLDETSVKEINFIGSFDIGEYFISVNDEGLIVAAPINELYVLDDVDIAYIDMDGDIEQDVIDYCVNEDKKVILFGEVDDEDYEYNCCDCINCKPVSTTSTTNYFVNNKSVSKEEYEEAMAELDKRYQKFRDETNKINRWIDSLSW